MSGNSAIVGLLRRALSEHRPNVDHPGYAARVLDCLCGEFPPIEITSTDYESMNAAYLTLEAHQATALMAAVKAHLTAARIEREKSLEQATEAPIGDLSKMRPDSAFAEGVAAGHPVQMTMVKPEECALFVLVDMAGVVNAQAVGLPKPDAGAVLRYLADQWDPDKTGAAAIRPAPPRTRPNGDPL